MFQNLEVMKLRVTRERVWEENFSQAWALITSPSQFHWSLGHTILASWSLHYIWKKLQDFMQPSAKIKSIILEGKHALCVTTETDRSKAHGQEHNARILAKLKLVCGGRGAVVKWLACWTSDLKVGGSMPTPCHCVSLDKKLYPTLSLSTQGYRWYLWHTAQGEHVIEPASHPGGSSNTLSCFML